MAQNSDDLMNPAASPSSMGFGVRRLNGKPLAIGLVVVTIFLALIVKMMYDRDEEQKIRAHANDDQGGDSSLFASSIAANAKPGYTPATPSPPPLVPISKEALDEPPPPPPLPRSTSTAPPPPRDDIGDKFKQMRIAALVSATRAKTTVNDSQTKLAAAGGTARGVAANARAELGERMDAMKKQMQAMQQSAQVPGTMTGVSVGRSGGASNPQMLLAQAGVGMGGLGGLEPVDNGRDPNDMGFDSRANFEQWDRTGPGDRWANRGQMQDPRSDFEMRAGTLIPAVLITGINSDLAGPITAQVSESVYDTPTGKNLLIPQGSKLFGRYSNQIAMGQSRVLVGWQRITFPDGRTLDIGSMPAADDVGYAGMSDQVNNHWMRLLGNALLLSAVTGGVALSQRDVNQSGGVYNASATQVMSQQLGVVLGRVISQVITRNLNISPTLEIRPGFRLNVITTKDLTFSRPYKPFDYSTSAGRN